MISAFKIPKGILYEIKNEKVGIISILDKNTK